MSQFPEKKDNLNPDELVENNIFKLLQRGICLQQRGKLNAAANIYQKIIKRDPHNINALNLLGTIANEQKRFNQAINVFKRAISIKPNHATLYTNLGIAFQGANKLQAAKQAYMEAITLNIEEHKAHYNLGVILQTENLYNDAIICYHKAIKCNPNNAKAYNNIGNIYLAQNRYEEAVVNFRQAIILFPNSYTTYNKLGLCLKDGSHNLKDAMIMFKKSLALNSEYPEAWNNLAICLKEAKKFEDAIFALNKSLRLSPNNPELHYIMGTIYQAAQNIREANLCYQNALAIDANHNKSITTLYYIKRQLCDWKDLATLEEKINDSKKFLAIDEEPFLNIIRTNNLKTNFKIAAAYSGQIKKKIRHSKQKFSFLTRKEKQEKLVVGYIAGNFYDYELTLAINELFALHDRKKFTVYCYGYETKDNNIKPYSAIKTADKFFNISNYKDAEVARSIYQDQVSILVDLTGYCPNHRIEIMALKPAPIQISYLGTPGTTGNNFYDYILVDQTICPEKDRAYYSEIFAYLPTCYQFMNFKQDSAIRQLTKKELGLPDNSIVLSSFNESYKLDEQFMNIWAEILAKIPNSILWLLQTNKEQPRYIASFMQEHNINPNRVYYIKPCPKNELLAKLKLADLNLDTHIYNGGIATSNALWLDIPTITLEGQNFASRTSASILRAIELEECITHSADEYKNKILELASDPIKLSNLKTKIAENKLNSTLFDSEKFIRDLETIYNKMWHEFITGKMPSVIKI